MCTGGLQVHIHLPNLKGYKGSTMLELSVFASLVFALRGCSSEFGVVSGGMVSCCPRRALSVRLCPRSGGIDAWCMS